MLRPHSSRTPYRHGLSLLELMLVLAILSLLMQLLLPALGAAREAARRMQCGRNLQQLGLAAQMHHDLWGAYPSGGWNYDWIGEPERGSGPNQPGGWPFHLLHYLDATPLRDAGRHLSGRERTVALEQRVKSPLTVFHCPTRRDAAPYPYHWNRRPRTLQGPVDFDFQLAAKTDYAANAGDQPETEFPATWTGPRSLSEGDSSEFRWPKSTVFTGVIFGRSRVRLPHVTDGTAHTYLLGEKYLDASQYRSGHDWGDNECLYTGFNNDNCRSTYTRPHPDTTELDLRNSFGSAHPNVWLAVMADGSLRMQPFDLDRRVHQQLGNRNNQTRSSVR